MTSIEKGILAFREIGIRARPIFDGIMNDDFTQEEKDTLKNVYNYRIDMCKNNVEEKEQHITWEKNSVKDYKGEFISFDRFLFKQKRNDAFKKRIQFGELRLDHSLYGKEVTVKVLNSNNAKIKEFEKFYYGKFVLVLNENNLKESKLIKNNTIKNYISTVKFDPKNDDNFIIYFNKIKNSCTLEDYKLYLMQISLLDVENNPNLGHELELAYFNKYKKEIK